MKQWMAYRNIIILSIIVIFGFILRIYDLDKIPPGLWYDEAIHGLDTLVILEEGKYPIFFDTKGHPQEPMFSYIIAVIFSVFGISAYSLRFTSVIIGTITLILFYFLVKRLFNENLALLSVFLLAISKWHLMFSRLSFRTILTPLFAILIYYFLYQGLMKIRNQNKLYYLPFIISGFFLGLGMYTYIAFRIMPILILIYFIYEWYQKKDSILSIEYIKSGIIFYLTGLLLFLPLLINYIQNPFHFFGRTDEISVFQNGILSAGQLIFWNTLKTIGMFSIIGDPEIKHNNPGEPILPVILSIFFIIGIIQSVRKRHKLNYFIPLSSLLIFLIPGILSIGAPNTLRTLCAIPGFIILIGLGMLQSYMYLSRWFQPNYRYILRSIFFTILLYSTLLVIYQYFYLWGNNPKTALHFNKNEFQLSQFLQQIDGQYDIYLPVILANQPVIRFVSRPANYYSYQNIEDLPAAIQMDNSIAIFYLNPFIFSNLDPKISYRIIEKYQNYASVQITQIPGHLPWVLMALIEKN